MSDMHPSDRLISAAIHAGATPAAVERAVQDGQVEALAKIVGLEREQLDILVLRWGIAKTMQAPQSHVVSRKTAI